MDVRTPAPEYEPEPDHRDEQHQPHQPPIRTSGPRTGGTTVRSAARALRDPLTAVAAVLTLVVAIAVGVVAGSLTSSRGSTYTSTAKLLINQPQALSLSQGDGVVLKLSRLRLKYIGLVNTPVIGDRIAVRLHRPPGQFGGLVDAIAPPQNLNINILGISASPTQAQTLAQLAAQELSAYATREQIANRIPANERFVLTVIAPAESAVRAAGSKSRPLFVGFGAGVLAGAAVAGAFYLQRRRRL